MLKDLFFFSKGERRGVLILSSLILLTFSVNFCIPTDTKEKDIVKQCNRIKKSEENTIEEGKTPDDFVDSTQLHDSASRNDSVPRQYAHRERRAKNNPPAPHSNRIKSECKPKFNYDTVRVEINSADTTELKRLRGIGSKLSARIVKYRSKIGKFETVNDLKKIYGLSDETFEAIKPHVWIKE